jgi:hypothetical protein
MRGMVLLLILGFSQMTEARAINNKALFRRCYALVTQSFPGANHALLTSVAAGQINPIDACLQVLDKAKLSTTTQTVVATGDTEARRVLNAFHALHYGWMDSRNFTTGNPEINNQSTRDMYDMTTPSFYYTRAIFHPTMKFSEIFTTNEVFQGIRTGGQPTDGPFTNQPLSNWTVQPREFVQSGDLIGIRSMVPYNMTLGPRNAPTYGSAPVFRNFGGGVLGAAPYINYTLRQDSGFAANAANMMPRKWSKAVLNDFMCRSLPVVRTADVLKYVVSTSSITFRTSETCTRCHATMDQMGGTIRNVTLTTYENSYVNNSGSPIIIVTRPTTAGAEAAWPTAADGSYYARPPTGRLVFRSYDGTATDVAVTGPADLGMKISQLNDPYVCAAKRYYQYFTGIDIPVRDFADPDPSIGYQLSSVEQKHWNNIVKLGLELKTHQSLRKLIESILRSPGFKESNFDVNGDLL